MCFARWLGEGQPSKTKQTTVRNSPCQLDVMPCFWKMLQPLSCSSLFPVLPLWTRSMISNYINGEIKVWRSYIHSRNSWCMISIQRNLAPRDHERKRNGQQFIFTFGESNWFANCVLSINLHLHPLHLHVDHASLGSQLGQWWGCLHTIQSHPRPSKKRHRFSSRFSTPQQVWDSFSTPHPHLSKGLSIPQICTSQTIDLIDSSKEWDKSGKIRKIAQKQTKTLWYI